MLLIWKKAVAWLQEHALCTEGWTLQDLFCFRVDEIHTDRCYSGLTPYDDIVVSQSPNIGKA